jgi:hypothetical protein
MTMRSEDVSRIAGGGGDVRTANGDKVGAIGEIYLDDESGRPSWVTVKTGLFGTQESFVPLARADLSGNDIVVPYEKDTIKGAPRVDAGGSLTPQEEKRLYSYYFEAQSLDAGHDDDVESGDEHDARDLRRDDRSTERAEDTGRNDDRFGDSQRDDDRLQDQVGTSRLRRYVVTEKVVPVSREEVPVEDSDRG